MRPDALRAWRDRMGWTQDQLAEALSADPEQPKVTRVTIGRWERGESTPPPYLRLALGPLTLAWRDVDRLESFVAVAGWQVGNEESDRILDIVDRIAASLPPRREAREQKRPK